MIYLIYAPVVLSVYIWLLNAIDYAMLYTFVQMDKMHTRLTESLYKARNLKGNSSTSGKLEG